MLAMVDQTPLASRHPASSLTTIAGKPAPTGTAPPCRSEHARDGGPSTADIQAPSVIVDDHRERARSYRFYSKPRYPNI